MFSDDLDKPIIYDLFRKEEEETRKGPDDDATKKTKLMQSTNRVSFLIQMQPIVQKLTQLLLDLSGSIPNQPPNIQHRDVFLLPDFQHHVCVLLRYSKVSIQGHGRIACGQICSSLISVDWRRGEEDDPGGWGVVRGRRGSNRLDEGGKVGIENWEGDVLG